METGINSTGGRGFLNRKKGVTPVTKFPKDPVMLLSYVNTQLRDFYSTMEEFCKAFDVSKDEIDRILDGIDYQYDPESNRYI